MTVTVKHADENMLTAIKVAALKSPKAKIKVRGRVHTSYLTENGFTPEFERQVLESAADLEKQDKAGTLRTFSSSAEFRKYMDEEYEDKV